MNTIRGACALSGMLLALSFPGVQAAIDPNEHPCDSLGLAELEAKDACVDGDTDVCKDRDKGWGWEYPSCFFECDPNQWLHVKASVDDDGWIDAKASCGGATATCDDNGSCVGDSPTPTTTPTRTSGTCKASTNGGWYTNGYVECWTTEAAKTVPELDVGRLLETIGEATGKFETYAYIAFDGEGGVSGLLCDKGGCRSAQPACVDLGALRTCSIGMGAQ